MFVVLLMMGLMKSTVDELNKTDEAILQDEPKQVPTSPTRASGLFNIANNASDGYQTSCTDRWEHTKEGINTKIPPTTARIQGNTYKALKLPTEGRETH